MGSIGVCFGFDAEWGGGFLCACVDEVPVIWMPFDIINPVLVVGFGII